jgi:hypothetical protein
VRKSYFFIFSEISKDKIIVKWLNNESKDQQLFWIKLTNIKRLCNYFEFKRNMVIWKERWIDKNTKDMIKFDQELNENIGYFKFKCKNWQEKQNWVVNN